MIMMKHANSKVQYWRLQYELQMEVVVEVKQMETEMMKEIMAIGDNKEGEVPEEKKVLEGIKG